MKNEKECVERDFSVIVPPQTLSGNGHRFPRRGANR